MDTLRAWLMPAETVPYVLATMGGRDSYMEAINVLPTGTPNQMMVLFKGSYGFLENSMKKERPDIIRDTTKWPEKLHKQEQ